MNYTIDLTSLVIALISICATLITSVAIPWLKTKLNRNQISIIEAVVSTAVYAAQQVYGNEDGSVRKQYAIEQINAMLAQYNITLSLDEISTYIEGTLKDIKIVNGEAWN